MEYNITTISVHPDRAKQLKEVRDERGYDNLDETLDALLTEMGE